ncbi:tetratricopeptide repeat protein [Streptomyces sp. 142MFCol3.1]|uniref:tetratricopeptide repeat protein n=1 Tax=Streptomyces sp. 142MFCol3.1 TaxID=1172179 RepID=UPI000401466F|nr:tetratricopeptide repeat protein [Streptomyces sp. 142MFCol3.1]
MAQTRRSMQQLIAQRRRQGFIGRGAERAAFRENLELPPEDERHRFLFHVHGNAGVGKTFLLRELEQLARERGALTAYVDESVGSVPEAMAAVAEHFARQGHRFKELERLLATHRERRHEAAAAADTGPGPEPADPSPAGMAAARATLVGLGLVPGVGAFAGALDPAQLAQGADRLRAGLSARFRNQEDVQLVLSPERVLTPVLLKELAEAAAHVPWAVLAFDTYERTGPFLDGWLHDVMTTDRYGSALPANIVVLTAGQRPLDPARWSGLADFVTEVPLGPFTETEARGLLAGKGVVAEPVVEEVLRLTGGLPVLVSTLAEQRPAGPDGIGDPSATAVERFLKWEQDPVRRAAALACALPRRLDADVFRAAVDCPDEEADALFGWLRGLPFVSDRGDRVQYHDVVRAPMLRLQRRRSPRGWADRHARLAAAFAAWRGEVAARLEEDEVWGDEEWRELRLAESYHLLCAGPRAAVPAVLRDVVDACGEGEVVAHRWARMLVEAGEDTDAENLGRWGRELLAELEDGTHRTLGLLLNRGGLDARGQAVARMLRGLGHRVDRDFARALVEYEAAIELDPELERAYYGRGVTHAELHAYEAALADLDRADELRPGKARILFVRGDYHRIMGHFEQALEDLDRAVAIDPQLAGAWASRGVTRHSLGRTDAALADLDRAVELDPEHVWALVRRARVRRSREEHTEQLADLDRAVALGPGLAWVACERGDALRVAGRAEEALADYDRAIALNDAYASAYASRGVARSGLGRHTAALADLDRALELYPSYAWALVQRSAVHRRLADPERSFADADRAADLWRSNAWVLWNRGEALRCLGRFEEARTDLDRALALDPDNPWAVGCRGAVLHELGLFGEALADLERAVVLDPDGGWYRMRRIVTLLAVGRAEDARTGLEHYLGRGDPADDAAWAYHTLARIHLLEDRAGRARQALTAAFAHGLEEPGGLEELAWAQRRAGEWAAARRTAERMGAGHAAGGAVCLALTVACHDGADAARPMWREAARLVPGREQAPGAAEFLRTVIDAGLEDWPALDDSLTRLLREPREWVDLAWLAGLLQELSSAPGAAVARLAPRLARVTEERDAIRARYAE